MKREELKEILPHREPMLLVDEIILNEDGSATGIYTVRGDEYFLSGHFPGNPVVPGVILCEMMAQTCCVLLGERAIGATPYYTGLNNVKFRNKVLPGDRLEFVCRITATKGPFCFAAGTGTASGKTAVTGEFSFMLDFPKDIKEV